MVSLYGNLLRINDKIRYKCGPNRINHRLYHVRGFVDEKIIVRRWNKRYQSWEYEVLDPIILGLSQKCYSLIRSKD